MKTAEELAEEHWKYIGKLIKFVYLSAFVHGHKHGQQSRFVLKDMKE